MKAMANVDGTITPAEEAKISILDRGFLYGDSIYEVTRTYQGVPFFYTEHFDRLLNSAKLAQINISQSIDFLKEEIHKTVSVANVQKDEDVYIRYAITRGAGPIDLDPNLDLNTSYIILVKPIPEWKKDFYENGVKLAIPQIRRNSPQSLDPNIKGGNYLNNILAVGEAKKLQADDALICNLDGKISESSNSNVLFIIEDKVITPSIESGLLKGLTKKVVQDICLEEKIEFVGKELNIEDIKSATECFLASATREIMPVQSIRLEDGQYLQYPKGGGKLTNHLQSAYKKYVENYVFNFKNDALF